MKIFPLAVAIGQRIYKPALRFLMSFLMLCKGICYFFFFPVKGKGEWTSILKIYL